MNTLKKYWKYKHYLLIILLLTLPFTRQIFVFLHIPNRFHEGIALFLVILAAILIFAILEEYTRNFFKPEEQKKDTNTPNATPQ